MRERGWADSRLDRPWMLADEAELHPWGHKSSSSSKEPLERCLSDHMSPWAPDSLGVASEYGLNCILQKFTC